MWLNKCHNPMIKKPNPGATCPTRVPICFYLDGIWICFLDVNLKLEREGVGIPDMERDNRIGGEFYMWFCHKNLKFCEV